MRFISVFTLTTLLLIACARDYPAIALMGTWGPPVEGYAARQSTYDITGGNFDARRIEPGETITLLDAEGAGIVRHIWTTMSAPAPSGRTMTLRMYWDGSDVPAVEVPLGDFFGVGHGIDADVHSLPISVVSNGKARNCWWPMPFSDGARITVTNDGEEACGAFYCYVDYLEMDSPPPTTERFHARYNQAMPTDFPENYLILETEGRGHYVGTLYNIESTEPLWWGEGDDLIEVDDREPLYGTGTEDYLNDAWGIRENDNLFHGTVVAEGYNAAGLRTTSYRWHILDPIPFREKLRVSIEHGHANDREDHMSSVAYWYQVPPASPAPPLPPAKERLEGRVTQRHIRSMAWELATNDTPEAVEALEALLPHADAAHTLLVQCMTAHARSQGHPTQADMDQVNSALRELQTLMGVDPGEDAPFIRENLPSTPEQEILRMVRRVQIDMERNLINTRGYLEPGNEVVVEARLPDGNLTASPEFESTPDWSYSYAKVEDDRLLGEGAHFTYGGVDPSWARFTPEIPQTGRYEVLVTFSYGANALGTVWEVRDADGLQTYPLDQRGRPGTTDRNNAIWHSLGTHRFEAGQSVENGSVTLNASNGRDVPNPDNEYRAYVDAVRLVYVGE